VSSVRGAAGNPIASKLVALGNEAAFPRRIATNGIDYEIDLSRTGSRC